MEEDLARLVADVEYHPECAVPAVPEGASATNPLRSAFTAQKVYDDRVTMASHRVERIQKQEVPLGYKLLGEDDPTHKVRRRLDGECKEARAMANVVIASARQIMAVRHLMKTSKLGPEWYKNADVLMELVG